MSERIELSPRSKLSNVDLLRGLAAFSILFWHYEILYYPCPGVNPVGLQRHVQPLFRYLEPLYLHGHYGVPFFWTLSGFIFFRVYGKRRGVGGWEFFVNRFTRLYPLHLVTLLFVAIVQCFSMYYFGRFQAWFFNDLKHFLLNVLFASSWGLEAGYSFNGPIWSVSVEVSAYVLFYAYLKAFGVSLPSSALFLVWGLVLNHALPGRITECGALFALGGFTHCLHELLSRRMGRRQSLMGALLGGALIGLAYGEGRLAFDTLLHWLAFPCLIWLAASLDDLGISTGRVGDRVGSLSYACYLVHVPLQLCLMCVLDAYFGSRAAVATPAFLIGFLVAVVVAAMAAHRFIERPAMKLGRAVLLPLRRPSLPLREPPSAATARA